MNVTITKSFKVYHTGTEAFELVDDYGKFFHIFREDCEEQEIELINGHFYRNRDGKIGMYYSGKIYYPGSETAFKVNPNKSFYVEDLGPQSPVGM